jgi:hypothetical protein
MDDADGGRRGLRARPGPGLRQALRDHWGLDRSAEVADLGGSSSLDDLALTLHCARADLDAEGGAAEARARLRRLVAGYDAGLEVPLSAAERAALPVAMARQPLSSIGGWVARLDDETTARRHAAGMGTELAAALQVMADLERWRDALA